MGWRAKTTAVLVVFWTLGAAGSANARTDDELKGLAREVKALQLLTELELSADQLRQLHHLSKRWSR
jgi:hypothetical protein